MSEIKQKLKEYLNRSYKQEIADSDNLFLLGAVDSMGIMSMIQHIEDTFQVTMDPEDISAENFESLNTIESLITSKKV